MHEADGVILIYNPDSPGQDQQIGDWYDFFVRKNGLKDEQCLVFAHRLGQGSSERFRPRKSSCENIILTSNSLVLFSPSFLQSYRGADDTSKRTRNERDV